MSKPCAYHANGCYIAGVDEAGRGPLAGPVIAAAVILNPRSPVVGLADSKAISEKRRLELYQEIVERSLAWGAGRAEPQEIDCINILQATLLAMQRAIANLAMEPELVLVDGNCVPKLPFPVRAIVRGDSLVPAISAASIIAKVSRDREMIRLEEEYPGYGFSRHKGYPTREHITQLARLGVTPHHRRSFSPVKRLLDKQHVSL